jgi:hypothetical protein
LQQSKVDAAVKLYGGQAGLLRLVCDLLSEQGGEDAYSLDMWGQVRGDVGDLLRRHLALARREDEADGIGTEFCGELRVGEICVGADFDPHGLVSRFFNSQTRTDSVKRSNTYCCHEEKEQRQKQIRGFFAPLRMTRKSMTT